MRFQAGKKAPGWPITLPHPARRPLQCYSQELRIFWQNSFVSVLSVRSCSNSLVAACRAVSWRPCCWPARPAAGSGQPGNIRRLRRQNLRFLHPRAYRKENAIDGDLNTSWSCALGQTDGQWLQLDWSRPQTISGVILHQTGRYMLGVDVQVRQGGNWVTVATSGFANQKPPLVFALPFKPADSASLRLSFQGPVALSEVEVLQDERTVAEMARQLARAEIAIAGDAAGGLLGTVSQEEGAKAVQQADITVSGTAARQAVAANRQNG